MGGKQIAILNPNNNSVDYTKNVEVIVSDKLKELYSALIVGTKTNSSSGVDGTYYLNSASALAAGVKPAACIGETDYASLEDAISEANSGATIKLKQSVSGVALNKVNKDLTIELKENTLAFASGTCINVSAKLSFEGDADKKSKITSSQNSLFAVYTNGELSLDGVTVEVESTEDANAIAYVYQGTDPGKITIKSSDLTMKGTYGIGTNAGSGESEQSKNVVITIEDSCITATRDNEDSTGLLVNVSSTVTIENSTISGDRQGAIFRGVGAGTELTSAVTIIKSTVEATGKNTGSDSNGVGDWEDGNEVPKAALVIGNKNGNYSQPTTVSLKDVELNVANPNVWKNIWVYQESNKNYVKVAGDIKETWTVNSNRNSADYPTAEDE